MRVDVERVVEALGILVQRKGNRFWASCPKRFAEDGTPDPHRDSDASWNIRLDPTDDRYGLHRCYGCGFGGYPVHLVAGVLGLDRAGARAWLSAYESGDVVPTEVVIETVEPQVRRDFALPPGVVQERDRPIHAWPTVVKRYLASRGLTPEQTSRWRLGYGVEGKLAGRIVIPVYDAAQRLISYTGRTYAGHAARYRNARLEDGADLTAIFGEERWPADASRATVIVCEGALNALACERVVDETISIGAMFGSQLWPRHVLKLGRFGRVVLATDPDAAGNHVAAELEDALARSCDVRRLSIPEGLDCADLEPEDLRARLVDVLR